MFIVIIDIDFKKELEPDLKKWFSKSNTIISKFEGLISRRLANSARGTQCVIIEHQSKETFDKMYRSKEYARFQSEAASLFMVKTIMPSVYNLV